MLKYQVNIKDVTSDDLLINFYSCNFLINESNETLYLECKYNKEIDLVEGETVVIKTLQLRKSMYSLTDVYNQKEVPVLEINKSLNAVYFELPLYINLHLTSIEEKKEVADISGIEKPMWWYLTFSDKHFFDEENDNNISIIINFKDFLYNEEKTVTLDNCIVENANTLKYNPKYEELNDTFAQTVFGSSLGNIEIARGEGYVINVNTIKRKHYIIDRTINDIDFYQVRHKFNVKLPINSKIDNTLLTQYAINDNFVKIEKEKAINSGVDMEKTIYHPFYKNNDELIPIDKINFNLHLRNRKGSDWKTDDSDYWNGVVATKTNNLTVDYDYFSLPYSESDKISLQSDNLSELGFNNNDVRFQKSRLKKTFLRLSYYDSSNVIDRNLLSYSTVFLNTNKLFSNMVKNLNTKGFKTYDKDTNKTKEHVLGLGVYNEIGISFNMDDYSELSLNDSENYRLSSQFSVEDRFLSTNSSEGFYTYLWKDYVEGTEPRDIYLHVDLHHAIFGRSIPFMTPYFGDNSNDIWDGYCDGTWWNKTQLNKKNVFIGFKSLNDIVNDWNNGGYAMARYLKYSVIHFKCEFNKKLNKYIYYISDDFYKNLEQIFDKETKTLNINLYEAKLSEGGSIKRNNYELKVDNVIVYYYYDDLYYEPQNTYMLNTEDNNTNVLLVSNTFVFNKLKDDSSGFKNIRFVVAYDISVIDNTIEDKDDNIILQIKYGHPFNGNINNITTNMEVNIYKQEKNIEIYEYIPSSEIALNKKDGIWFNSEIITKPDLYWSYKYVDLSLISDKENKCYEINSVQNILKFNELPISSNEPKYRSIIDFTLLPQLNFKINGVYYEIQTKKTITIKQEEEQNVGVIDVNNFIISCDNPIFTYEVKNMGDEQRYYIHMDNIISLHNYEYYDYNFVIKQNDNVINDFIITKEQAKANPTKYNSSIKIEVPNSFIDDIEKNITIQLYIVYQIENINDEMEEHFVYDEKINNFKINKELWGII